MHRGVLKMQKIKKLLKTIFLILMVLLLILFSFFKFHNMRQINGNNNLNQKTELIRPVNDESEIINQKTDSPNPKPLDELKVKSMKILNTTVNNKTHSETIGRISFTFSYSDIKVNNCFKKFKNNLIAGNIVMNFEMFLKNIVNNHQLEEYKSIKLDIIYCLIISLFSSHFFVDPKSDSKSYILNRRSALKYSQNMRLTKNAIQLENFKTVSFINCSLSEIPMKAIKFFNDIIKIDTLLFIGLNLKKEPVFDVILDNIITLSLNDLKLKHFPDITNFTKLKNVDASNNPYDMDSFMKNLCFSSPKQ